MLPFLYFPDDKTEYIPAVIVLLLFVGLAGFTLYLVYKKSKKDEEKFNEQYSEQLREAKETSKSHQHE